MIWKNAYHGVSQSLAIFLDGSWKTDFSRGSCDETQDLFFLSRLHENSNGIGALPVIVLWNPCEKSFYVFQKGLCIHGSLTLPFLLQKFSDSLKSRFPPTPFVGYLNFIFFPSKFFSFFKKFKIQGISLAWCILQTYQPTFLNTWI